MVFFCPEVLNSGGKQSPLHTRLDLHGGIGNDEFFESGEVTTVIFISTHVLGVSTVNLAVIDQEF